MSGFSEDVQWRRIGQNLEMLTHFPLNFLKEHLAKQKHKFYEFMMHNWEYVFKITFSNMYFLSLLPYFIILHITYYNMRYYTYLSFILYDPHDNVSFKKV